MKICYLICFSKMSWLCLEMYIMTIHYIYHHINNDLATNHPYDLNAMSIKENGTKYDGFKMRVCQNMS